MISISYLVNLTFKTATYYLKYRIYNNSTKILINSPIISR